MQNNPESAENIERVQQKYNFTVNLQYLQVFSFMFGLILTYKLSIF